MVRNKLQWSSHFTFHQLLNYSKVLSLLLLLLSWLTYDRSSSFTVFQCRIIFVLIPAPNHQRNKNSANFLMHYMEINSPLASGPDPETYIGGFYLHLDRFTNCGISKLIIYVFIAVLTLYCLWTRINHISSSQLWSMICSHIVDPPASTPVEIRRNNCCISS